jgi:hypothetical protein
MSQNPFMVPVAFEMASAPVGSAVVNGEPRPSLVGGGQTFMTTGGFQGFSQQQFMVVPQQQPIMLQQVGSGLPQVQENSSGHWPQTQSFPTQAMNGYPQSNFAGVHTQQQPQLQHATLQAQHPPQNQQQQHQQQHLQQQQQQQQQQQVQQQAQQTPASNPFDPLSN